MTSVLIADDQELVRAGLRTVLDRQDGIEVVAEAADGREAVDGARRLSPDVVLMDVRMPRMDGIAATRELCAEEGSPRVLVVTTFDLEEYVFAVTLGAFWAPLYEAWRDERQAPRTGVSSAGVA